ncbi:MAG TPA: type 1 glutamine amidotransferase [Gaiellaceae bacterium]|nr:type 1 glutamine amidotransferase [Gaiellaceae bacterium]
MNVLAVIHGRNAPGGIFGDVVAEAGHRYEEWSLVWGTPPPRRLEDYGAVLVFGGSMHADQEDQHPWLREEDTFIRGLLERGVPMLGVCLGIQLMAKADGAAAYPLEGGPEIGWFPVEVTDDAAADPIFGRLPATFEAFGWHYYTYDLPEQAVELARSARCNQAIRLREHAWGIQFHAEVTRETARSWLDDPTEVELDLDRGRLGAEIDERIGTWNAIGRELCGAFVEIAERAAVAA